MSWAVLADRGARDQVGYASPLNVGEGWVKTSHGVLPVPPPAVAEILKGVPVYSAHAREHRFLLRQHGRHLVGLVLSACSAWRSRRRWQGWSAW